MSSRTRIAVVLVVAGAAIAGVGLVSRRRPVNVLLITVDTLRADHCSLYGYGRPTTPELERLAARGTTYEQADAAAAFTQGSVGTILTGLWPRQHGAASHPSVLDSASETLAEALKARGYETRAVVTNPILRERAGFDQGFDHYVMEPMQLGPDGRPVMRAAERTTDLAIRELSSFGTSAPFLLWVHYMDPHWWYTPPPPFDTAYSPALPEWTAFHEGTFDGSVPAGTVYFSNPLSAQGRQRGIDLYDGEIRYTDQEIGRLLREIDARGLAARTLVVFTADHGESLGEHGITFCHGYFTYEDNLHVPLVLAGPGIAKGRVAVPLSLVDLKETILRAVDPARPARPPSRICGESEPVYGSSGIHPDIAGRPRAYVPGDKGKWRSVRDGNLKLIRIPGQPGSELELYDLAADPGEAHDVAAARPADRDRLAAELDAP